MEHFVVFDTQHSQAHVEQHIAAYAGRARRLHIVALARGPLPGFARMPRSSNDVTLDVLTAPLAEAVPELRARIDALHLRGIADAGAGWARQLSRLCAPGAALRAEGLSALQVKALADVGFAFDEARTRAVYMSRKPQASPLPVPERRAIVVGAGIAGSAACERLTARGWQVTLVERHAQAAHEASGNLAGIFMPLVSKDDNIPTRLARAAYLFALRYWDHLGNRFIGERCGVLQLARHAEHARVQRAIAEKWQYPPEFAQWLDSEQASELLGRIAPDGGWLFPQGGWARPSSVCTAMLDACGDRLTRIFNTGSVSLRRGDQWEVCDAGRAVVATAPTVVLANGVGALSLVQTAALPLARVRGQVTHLDAVSVPSLPLVLCREAYMTPAVGGIVSAGATYDDIDDPQLLPSCHHENILKARALLGDAQLASDAPLAGRVGFRCVPPDRLPLVGALPDEEGGILERLRDVPRHAGLYGLLGYASRGLIWAPLCAEFLAAQLEGEPSPLEKKLAAALDPGRFRLAGKQHRRAPMTGI